MTGWPTLLWAGLKEVELSLAVPKLDHVDQRSVIPQEVEFRNALLKVLFRRAKRKLGDEINSLFTGSQNFLLRLAARF